MSLVILLGDHDFGSGGEQAVGATIVAQRTIIFPDLDDCCGPITADKQILKQPAERFPIDLDFSKRLKGGVTVTAIAGFVDAAGLVEGAGQTFTATVVTAWISGGTDQTVNRVQLNVTTSQGGTRSGDFLIVVKDE